MQRVMCCSKNEVLQPTSGDILQQGSFLKHPTLTPNQSLDDSVHAMLSKATMGLSPISLALAYADWAMHLSTSPGKQLALVQLAAKLSVDTMSQQVSTHTDHATSVKDPRFENKAWSNWPYKLMKDGYQANEAWWKESTQVTGVSKHHEHLMRFFTRQWLDAISPSNWAASNPEVLDNIKTTGGQSLLKGMHHYAEDVKTMSEQQLRLEGQEAPNSAFEVGKDVAEEVVGRHFPGNGPEGVERLA